MRPLIADRQIPWKTPSVVFLVFGVFFPATPARGDTPISLQEIQKKWDEYVRLVARHEGTVKYQRVDLKTGAMVARGASRMAVDGSDAFSQGLEPLPQRRIRLVYGTNGDYAFTLNALDQSNQWGLTGLDWNANPPPNVVGLDQVIAGTPVPRPENRLGLIMLELCRGLVVDNTWLPYIMRSPEFRIIGAAPVNNSNTNVIRIQYKWEPTESFLIRNTVVRSGEVVLDGNNYWLIRHLHAAGIHAKNRHAGTVTIDNSYSTDPDGLPLIKKSIFRESGTLDDGYQLDVQTTFDCDFQPITQVSRESFHLSGFGISEPTRPNSPRLLSSRMFWLGANLAAILLIIGVVILRRRRTRAL